MLCFEVKGSIETRQVVNWLWGHTLFPLFWRNWQKWIRGSIVWYWGPYYRHYSKWVQVTLASFLKGAFLWYDPDKDQWSEITRIMVDQMNQRLLVQSGFIDSSDLTWSEWSWITDPDPDHPKGTHPKRCFKFYFFSVFTWRYQKSN